MQTTIHTHPTIDLRLPDAFCDHSQKPPRDWEAKRRLHFLSTIVLNRDRAETLLRKYYPALEDFDPSCIKLLPDDSLVRIGREYSLVLYVESSTDPADMETIAHKMKANEFSLHQTIGERNVYRIWWD